MDESVDEVAYRLKTEAQARRLADMLKAACPPGVGFSLFLFTYGEADERAQHLAYVSTARRADMIALIEEWLARMKRA